MTPIAALLVKALPFVLAAPTAGDPCSLPSQTFFFIPPWWEFLQPRYDTLGQCVVTLSDQNGNFHLSDIWAVGLAGLDILLRIGGFLAVISIIIAGIQYITATGEPEKGASARKRLTNSLIGLAIVLIATGAVTFIGKAIQ